MRVLPEKPTNIWRASHVGKMVTAFLVDEFDKRRSSDRFGKRAWRSYTGKPERAESAGIQAAGWCTLQAAVSSLLRYMREHSH